MKSDLLTQQVYEYISKKIQSGEYRANQRITEGEICKVINVSRTPAREALTRLAGENLLEKIPNKGFIVKEFNEKEKLDTYSVIGELDAFSAQLAMKHITKDDLTTMQELAEMMEISIKYSNYKKYNNLSNEFHDIYIQKSDNKVLIEILNSLRYNFIPKPYESDNNEELNKMLLFSNKDHFDIVKYFTQKDEVNLKKAVKNHWETFDINEMV